MQRPLWIMSGVAYFSLWGCHPAEPPKEALVEKESSEFEEGDRIPRLHASLERGDYSEAQVLLEELGAADPKSSYYLPWLDVVEAQRKEETLQTILSSRSDDFSRLALARSLRRQGDLSGAVEVLDHAAFRQEAQSLGALLLEGEIFQEQGEKESAEQKFLEVVQRGERAARGAESGQLKADLWTLVGEAAGALRAVDDANAAYDFAEQAGGKSIRLFRDRAELYLKHHDRAHALEVASELDEIAPGHPDVLVLLARVLIETSLNFREAEKLIDRALATAPRHLGALTIRASIALHDLDFAGVDQAIDTGLQKNPRDLDLLSLQATRYLLAEEKEIFDEVVAKIHRLSPGYAGVYLIAAQHLEWEHRYSDMQLLLRSGLRRDADNAAMRSLLGLTLVRAGSDAAGVVELRQAFRLDPYNLRVFNTLKLYEEIIPENYTEYRQGPFLFRFPVKEAELLNRYIPQLAQRAYDQMSKTYDYRPIAPVQIEIYSNRDEFAVRTSGLPRTPIQGVCFGRKLATISPEGSRGNLGMTLWHEMAHVFHIGKSESRVPRWLTEGAAEWETARLKVGWSREMDRNLARALVAEKVPHLPLMNRAFTRAERMEDVAVAYYASGRVVEWLSEEVDNKALTKVLAELGKKQLPDAAFENALGRSLDDLDQEFRLWAERELTLYTKHYLEREESQSLEELEVLLRESPEDRPLRIRAARAALQLKKLGRAQDLLESLLAEKMDAEVVDLSAAMWGARGDQAAARRILENALQIGLDAYALRMRLARLQVAAGDWEPAVENLIQAHQLDPGAVAPLEGLVEYFQLQKDETNELKFVELLASLLEQDVEVQKRYLELLIRQGNVEKAARVAKWSIFSGLGNSEIHSLSALAHARSDDFKTALYEWESALLCTADGDQRATIYAQWIEESDAADRVDLKEKAQRALAKERASGKIGNAMITEPGRDSQGQTSDR
ncbi:MAG: hypothetical protein MK135_00930 [Polyangiaceae bacterium]|nr:hypothetical protein [Polyangiaceae bacterium]